MKCNRAALLQFVAVLLASALGGAGMSLARGLRGPCGLRGRGWK